MKRRLILDLNTSKYNPSKLSFQLRNSVKDGVNISGSHQIPRTFHRELSLFKAKFEMKPGNIFVPLIDVKKESTRYI